MSKLSPEAKERKRLRGKADTKDKKRLGMKADALWQKCVKLERPRCEVCGKPVTVGHHFFPKGSCSELRYELQNGIGMCIGCHLKIHNAEPPACYVVRDERGEDWYDALWARRWLECRRSKAEYEGEIERLTARLEELEGKHGP